MHSVTPLDTNPPAERLRVWTHHLRSVPQKLKSILSEELGPGSEVPWLHWKLNMLKWKYSDADTIIVEADTDYGPSTKVSYAASGMFD